jgi:hypothetical protein
MAIKQSSINNGIEIGLDERAIMNELFVWTICYGITLAVKYRT